MKEPCSRRDGATRFRHGFGILGQYPHGLHNFVFGDGDHIIHVALDVINIPRRGSVAH